MAKRSGGFPGMGGNMNQLMKQAQKMQKQMEETTKALEESTYEATAGGGVVKVVVSGKKEVQKHRMRVPQIQTPLMKVLLMMRKRLLQQLTS